jgi:hypothetical protein
LVIYLTAKLKPHDTKGLRLFIRIRKISIIKFSIPSLRSPLLLSHPFHLSVISSFHFPLPSSNSFTLKQFPQSRSSIFYPFISFLLYVLPILFTCTSPHRSISPSFLPLLYVTGTKEILYCSCFLQYFFPILFFFCQSHYPSSLDSLAMTHWISVRVKRTGLYFYADISVVFC